MTIRNENKSITFLITFFLQALPFYETLFIREIISRHLISNTCTHAGPLKYFFVRRGVNGKYLLSYFSVKVDQTAD